MDDVAWDAFVADPVAGDTPTPSKPPSSMCGGRMDGRPDAREGRDGVMEEASGDLYVEGGGRTEIGDPSVGLLSTVFAW